MFILILFEFWQKLQSVGNYEAHFSASDLLLPLNLTLNRKESILVLVMKYTINLLVLFFYVVNRLCYVFSILLVFILRVDTQI